MAQSYQMCTYCAIDSSDPEVVFDATGRCNHCLFFEAEQKRRQIAFGEKEKALQNLVQKIKKEGRNKNYDCIIGVSGGVDSTYVAYLVKELGLRPLAVHFDNGWNSELAVSNIEKTLKNLDIDLYTYVMDWEEFKDLQLSFLKASTPDSEIPTDHGIVSTLYQQAQIHGISYILAGTNWATEAILPRAWSQGHGDWKYIKTVQKTFGKKPLSSFPHYSFTKNMYYRFVSRIQWVSILDYVDYVKQDALEVLKQELGWRPYGGKHYESIYTRFFQGYILPTKFGFDKRRGHFSSLICSGQMTKAEALDELKKNPYPNQELLREDREFVIKKLRISEKEFEDIMRNKPMSYWDYPNYQKTWWFDFIRNSYRSAKRLLSPT